MANSPQARKRARQAVKSREQNMSLRSTMRTAIKKILKAIESGKRDEAQTAFKEAMPVIDSMVNKGIAHRNKIARHKSRLNARIRAMG